ncbi:MAG: pilus (MSHA type) biogenesis protein MshL [Ketobacteraceae bacterium]|nr:pilus (MSHA type) biogenesis protein MshL [Ketobacteraceae bacterium]
MKQLAIICLVILCSGCSDWRVNDSNRQPAVRDKAGSGSVAPRALPENERQPAAAVSPMPAAKVPVPVAVPKPVAAPRPQIKQPRFDVAAADAPAREFFMSLVQGSDMNMIVHPDVAGNITIQLKQVTLEEALSAVRDVYGYDFVRKAYGYQIVPRELQSKVFRINYLNINRVGKSATSVSSGQITSSGSSSTDAAGASSATESVSTIQSTQIQTQSESNFWAKLQNLLTMIVGTGDGRNVVVDADSGIAVVKAYPGELRYVEDFLAKAQLSLQQQVIIEAKILEVNLGEGYQAGIQWDTFGQGYGGQLTDSTNEVVGALQSKTVDELVDQTVEGMFTLGLNFTDFTGVISLLESQGDVQVLSSPRIATVNNQKAVIKVGTDEFFVTEISSSTTATSTTTVDSPEVTLTPFFSGIALDVTPHIGEGNDVTLHVHPTVTEVTERVKNVGIGDDNLVLPLAFSSIRETDSVIRAEDGQVVIIGGLMQTSREKKDAGIPYLSRIPGLGKLFKQERDISKKSELVILLRPQVVNSEQWKDDYEILLERFPGLQPQASQ